MDGKTQQWDVYYLYDVEHFLRCREWGEAGMHFEAFEVVSFTEPVSPVDYGCARRGSVGCNDVVDIEALDEAERAVSGYVKWDGCSHFYFGETGNDGYLHLCSKEEGEKVSGLIRHIFDIAREFYQVELDW